MTEETQKAISQIGLAQSFLQQTIGSQNSTRCQEAESLACSTLSRLTKEDSNYHKQLNVLLQEKWPSDPLVAISFFRSRAERLSGMLSSLRRDIVRDVSATPKSDIPSYLSIERILSKFHVVALQLAKRHDHRDSLRIMDEYDVQDLIHALLKIDFEDIRPEEYTPSYAGKSSRMDFLLKKQHVVLEVKMTRESLRDKQLGDELLIDIARYARHPDCSTLICFIYDPQNFLTNPAGLKNDLEAMAANELTVVVIICQH